MKDNKQLKNNSKNPFSHLLIFAVITTLYFNSQLQDPFNSPKQWILFIAASWFIGHLIVSRNSLKNEVGVRFLKYLLLIFITSLLVSTIFTDVAYNALLGDTQRRLGFLTYCGFAIFMFISAFYIRISVLNRLYLANFGMGLVLGSYGLLQYFGRDFVPWNNQYNRIIGTLGNPNFASSMMAIITCLCISTLLVTTFSRTFRLSNLILAAVLLFEINSSESIQGLVALSVGVALIIIVLMIQRSKVLALAGGVGFSTIGILAIVGMLQIGPLTNLLYKDSVTVRGFYWRAGFEMFKDNPWLGVGIDRFGSYFKQYKDQQYVLKYGYDISSSSAHNTFIQMFATAGFLVGSIFLILHFYILICGIKLITKANKENQLCFSGLFAAWLVYVSQMVISIDNIGLTIWGWIFGGSIVGLYARRKQDEPEVQRRDRIAINKSSTSQSLVSGVLTLITVIFVAVLYRGESISIQARGEYNFNNPSDSPKLFEIANRTFQTPLIDPLYKLKIAELLAMSGRRIEAQEVMKRLSSEDPRNQDYLMSLAALTENLGDYESAIIIRKNLAKYDPWNAKNFLELGRNYKLIGNFEEMVKYREIVQRIDGLGAESKIAKEELVS